MKIFSFFLFILAFVFFMGSCKKELKETPYSTLSPDNVFTSEDGLKKAVLGVYQSWTAMDFYGVYFRFVLAESGHRYATQGIYGAAFIDPYYRFAEKPTDGVATTVWSRMFMTISRANAVIDNATKAVSDTAVANKYIAEAKFLRAYAYFNLVRNFGGVPLIRNEITSLQQSDLIYGANATIEDTYNFILEDMQYAEANLPDTWGQADAGRVAAGTAKAMLGKVYLTMAGKPLSKPDYFQKAVDKLQEVTGAANEAKYGFGLENNFREVFSINNKHNKEIVLSFSYFLSSANSNASIYPFFIFPRGLVNGDEQTNYGLTYDFYKLFEAKDARRDFTVVDRYVFAGSVASDGANPGDSIIYDPVDKHYIVKNTNAIFGNTSVKSGLAYGKFDRVARPAGSVPWGYSTDLLELRFSDVLLCLAEALTETGKPAEALPLLNRVRTRSNATPAASAGVEEVRSAIRNERRLELTGEFTTVYDIRRWGTLPEEIAAMSPNQVQDNQIQSYSPKLELYPIPQTQLDANPNLKQNAGW